MSMFVIILLAFQDIMLFPIAAFPRFISIPAIIIRRFFLPVQSKQAPKRWSYTVAQLLPQNPTGREKSLALILQDDKIVERVARHLHYDDLVNLSLASKLTRTAMFYPSMDPSSRQERIESLCIASCLDGQKSECWSCERVICDVSTHVQPAITANSLHFPGLQIRKANDSILARQRPFHPLLRRLYILLPLFSTRRRGALQREVEHAGPGNAAYQLLYLSAAAVGRGRWSPVQAVCESGWCDAYGYEGGEG
ncbi:hypothetical protein ACHAQK_003772 [Fusarium lateritium]